MKYELFYNTGGHGGPYTNIKEAVRSAKHILKGNINMSSIDIINYKDWKSPPYKKTRVVAKIKDTVERIQVTRY